MQRFDFQRRASSVAFFQLFTIGVLASFLLASCSYEDEGKADMEVFRANLDDMTLPELLPGECLQSDEITEYTEKRIPPLGQKWKEIRNDYNLHLEVICLLEYKRAQLLEIATFEGADLNLASADSYIKLLKSLKNNAIALREQHEKIRIAAETYYAADTVRDIWSNHEMAGHINSLIEKSNQILQITKLNVDMTLRPPSKDQEDGGRYSSEHKE